MKKNLPLILLITPFCLFTYVILMMLQAQEFIIVLGMPITFVPVIVGLILFGINNKGVCVEKYVDLIFALVIAFICWGVAIGNLDYAGILLFAMLFLLIFRTIIIKLCFKIYGTKTGIFYLLLYLEFIVIFLVYFLVFAVSNMNMLA